MAPPAVELLGVSGLIRREPGPPAAGAAACSGGGEAVAGVGDDEFALECGSTPDAVARVSQRRIAFLAGLLEETGHDHTEALRRSVIALAFTTGIAQILDVGPRASRTPGLSSMEITNTLLAMVLSRNP